MSRITPAIKLALLLFFTVAGAAQVAVPEPGKVRALTSQPAAVLAVAEDLATVPAQLQPYMRYLVDWDHEQEFVSETLYPVIAYHVNAFSRRLQMSPVVPHRRVGAAVLRVNLQELGIPVSVWERLADVDPYFHVKNVGEVVVPFERREFPPDGWWIKNPDSGNWVREKDWTRGKSYRVKTTTAYAPQLIPLDKDGKPSAAHVQALATIVAKTESKASILSAQWFYVQTSIQEDRDDSKTGYYDFLGTATYEDFLEIGGGRVVFDKAVQRELELGNIVRRSRKVALGSRQVRWVKMLTGWYAFTIDARKSTGATNAVRNINGLKADAHEDILPGANGLPRFWLRNGKDQRQNAAPDFIAHNTRATDVDGRVHINRTCLECHAQVLHPVADYAREVLVPPRGLGSPDLKEFFKIRQLYHTPFKELFDQQVAEYDRATRLACGLSSKQLAEALGRVWDDYVVRDFDPERVARLTGNDTAAMLALLRNREASQKYEDLVLSGLLAKNAEPLRSDQFEELFPYLVSVLRGGEK